MSEPESTAQKPEPTANDYDEDEDYEEDVSGTLLGFAEDPNRPLLSRYFPSKIGGKPAWLNLRNIPPAPKCAKCGQILSFLIQVYAPRSEEQGGGDETFHRTLFVFVCRKASCLATAGSVRVLRSQLPRVNNFYSSEPPPPPSKEDDALSEEDKAKLESMPFKGVNLCRVCGVKSAERCGRCHMAYYCCRQHQTAHWKADHKYTCTPVNANGDKADAGEAKAKGRAARRTRQKAWDRLKAMVFPEYELVIEEELQADIEDYSKEKKLLDKYEETQSSMSKSERDKEDQAFRTDKGLTGAFEGVDAAAVRQAIAKGKNKGKTSDKKAATPDAPDRSFDRFQALTRANPEQVVRYSPSIAAPTKGHDVPVPLAPTKPKPGTPGGGPLWICEKGQIDEKTVPKCASCGRKRSFEFQIMPQLLNFLKIDPSEQDSLDYGIIAVYTCNRSCGDGGKEYFEEHAYCQPMSK
mmetsp:Transcript_1043/g.2033  ORF Transcript_1043/g.2033 Transcript_1043/m.2033 type:complete len:465 (-) Transcript_1043:39-1433(-)